MHTEYRMPKAENKYGHTSQLEQDEKFYEHLDSSVYVLRYANSNIPYRSGPFRTFLVGNEDCLQVTIYIERLESHFETRLFHGANLHITS